MVATPTIGALTLLLSRLAKYQKKAAEINAACEALGLPPALDIHFEDKLRVWLDPVYNMEGFGAVMGLPPKLSFYVHYKKGKPEHVEVGKFLIPIAFGDLIRI